MTDAKTNIRDLQIALGFTGKEVDGIRGKMTNERLFQAVDAGRVRIEPAQMVIIKTPDAIHPLDLNNLKGVNAKLVSVIEDAARTCPVQFAVIEGLRTAARQAQLVKAGASKTQNSRHLTGHAVDLWPVDAETGSRVPSDAAFPKGSKEARAADARLWADLRVIAKHVKEAGQRVDITIEWGGDWGWDAPHFQLTRTQFPV